MDYQIDVGNDATEAHRSWSGVRPATDVSYALGDRRHELLRSAKGTQIRAGPKRLLAAMARHQNGENEHDECAWATPNRSANACCDKPSRPRADFNSAPATSSSIAVISERSQAA